MAITDADIKATVCAKYGIEWDDDNPEQDVTVYRGRDLSPDNIFILNIFENASSLTVFTTQIGSVTEIIVLGEHTMKTDAVSNWEEWTGVVE
jgi:hypothetical protein